MKSISDDEHIKTYVGYNRLNLRYKQCVRCRTKRTECRNNNIEHARELQKIHYEHHNDQQLAQTKVYHKEKVQCNIYGKTITRKTRFKHKYLQSCKAIAHVCKCHTEMLDDNPNYKK